MPWIAGIDEVGYGPLLGPLVVSTALFETPGTPIDFWGVLSPVVRRRAARDSLAVCDSKLLHRPDDLRPLERTAVSFWQARDGAAERTFFEFVSAHCPEAGDQLAAAPWYASRGLPLPFAHSPGALDPHVALLRGTLRAAGIRFASLHSALVEPPAFNDGVRRLGNKADLLFETSGRLYRRLWDAHGSTGALSVIVGKQGGRAFYAERLQTLFPDARVLSSGEHRGRSDYTIEGGGRRMQLSFVAEAEERHFPVALASIFAKYTREGLMECFNRWWTGRRPGLRPTAGYHTDALRFLRDTEDLRRELGIEDRSLVRER